MRSYIGEYTSGMLSTLSITMIPLIYQEYTHRREEELKVTGYLKAIYTELREAKFFLKDFSFDPNVITRIPILPTASWEAAKFAGIIDPKDPLYIKLRDVYRGFQLINENVQVATLTATLSVRSDWKEIASGMMELVERINSWLFPMLVEAIDDLERKIRLPPGEVTEIEEELRKRKIEYIKNKIKL